LFAILIKTIGLVIDEIPIIIFWTVWMVAVNAATFSA
jgi:hypothetical protein